LEDYRDVPFNQLSSGLKQRLALAKSLVNDPTILFLDEPTAGVDPAVGLLLRSRLQEWRSQIGATIVLTTHQMDEAERLSDIIAFLKEGHIIRIGRPAELKSGINFQRRLVVDGTNLKPLCSVVDHMPGMTVLEAEENRLTCRIEVAMDSLNPLLESAISVGASIENIEITKPTLEDVFVELANRPDTDERLLFQDMADH
jgi:ABC-2 type transport system ATP-binding protein